MTRVSFYFLENSLPGDRLPFASRLATTAWRKGHRIVVMTESRAEAEALDEMMWTQPAESFLPHQLADEGPQPPAPVLITWPGQSASHQDVLINLGASIPERINAYRRVIEVISSDDNTAESGRTRFRHYRQQGLQPDTYRIAATGNEQGTGA